MANLMMQNCVSPFIVGKHQLLDGLRSIYEKTQKSEAFSDQNRDVPVLDKSMYCAASGHWSSSKEEL
jgi:hypothetical protein